MLQKRGESRGLGHRRHRLDGYCALPSEDQRVARLRRNGNAPAIPRSGELPETGPSLARSATAAGRPGGRMNPGDVFNPWFGECGFYPGDIVCKQSSKTLSQGQKLLYTRLVRYAGRDGRCFPSQERLATDLGISERQVRKDLIRIEAFRLIDRQAREGRRGDTYTFLWHPMFDVFDRNYSSAQTGGNEDLTGTPVPLKPGIGGPRPEPNEDLTGTKGSFDRNCGSAYPIKKPSEKSSSSFPSSSES